MALLSRRAGDFQFTTGQFQMDKITEAQVGLQLVISLIDADNVIVLASPRGGSTLALVGDKILCYGLMEMAKDVIAGCKPSSITKQIAPGETVQLVITLLKDGRVVVQGPLYDPSLCEKILGCGRDVVKNHKKNAPIAADELQLHKSLFVAALQTFSQILEGERFLLRAVENHEVGFN